MSTILAIDPGYTQSAWLVLKEGQPVLFSIDKNEDLVRALEVTDWVDVVAIEKVESFGMAVGKEVFDTVHWAGRFHQAAHNHDIAPITRREVKLHLCGSSKATDATIRQALIDRFGGSAAIGTKKAPGPLYGIHKDVWSALAIAITAQETRL